MGTFFKPVQGKERHEVWQTIYLEIKAYVCIVNSVKTAQLV